MHPSDTGGGFPAIQAEAPRRAVAARRPQPRPANRRIWILAGGATAGLLLIGLVVWLAFSLESGQSPRGEAMLVLDWPDEQRGGAALHIDDQQRDLPQSGPLEFALPAGEHRLLLKRRGYEQLEVSLSLRPGDRHQYQPRWSPSAFAGSQFQAGSADDLEIAPLGLDGWTQNLNTAQRAAADNSKDLLILFCGSDWDSDSMHLAAQVLTTGAFHRLAQDRFELVVIDLPRSAQGRERLLDFAQNIHLREHYHVQHIPTVILADEAGQPYARHAYLEAEAHDDFVQTLQQLQAGRQQRDELFARTRSGGSDQRLQAARQTIQWLQERELTRSYSEQIGQWLALARQADPDNEQGHYEELFAINWLMRLQQAGEQQDPAGLQQVVAELHRWGQQRRFQNPDRAAELYLLATRILMVLEQEDEAVELIARGLTYRPTDRELSKQLQAASRYLNARDQLSSGTGFLVAQPGFLLTNQHVVDGPGTLVVRLPDGETQPAEVVAEDVERDLALLRVQLPPGAPVSPLPIAPARVGRGAPVAAFGFPLGDTVGEGLKLTTGVVSGLPEHSDNRMLLLDCRINPGNSGGPLCNHYGQVIGMVTAKSAGGFGVDSYGMALPGDDLQTFLQRHLPNYQPPPETRPAAPLQWDEIDRQVSPAVLMVLKLRQ